MFQSQFQPLELVSARKYYFRYLKICLFLVENLDIIVFHVIWTIMKLLIQRMISQLKTLSEYTVATKIIQQAVTLFSPTLYLLYSKSYGSRVFIYLYHKVSSICMISFSSIDQTVHFLLKKKIITYNFSPSKSIQQVTFWDRKRWIANNRFFYQFLIDS